MSKLIDLTGFVYGKLTVVRRISNSNAGQPRWLCTCECGNISTPHGLTLRSGDVNSCGCLRTKHSNTKHGGDRTKTYRSWEAMKQRCNNPNNASFKWYGGRGITYTKEWESFDKFLADMGDRPDNMTIDRIAVNGDYCLDNCRWATALEQRANRRN